jgi:hypothetical protein
MASRLAAPSPGAISPACKPGVTHAARRRPPAPRADKVVELLQPGSFVRLRNQPDDLPPFELIRCRGGRCWVRQQAWGALVQWEVEHRRLTAAA